MQKQPSPASASASAKEVQVKQELEEFFKRTEERSLKRNNPHPPISSSSSLPKNVIELSDSDDDDDDDDDDDNDDANVTTKKQKLNSSVSLPPGFLDPIPPLPESSLLSTPPSVLPQIPATRENCKQFWKAGDYEGAPSARWDHYTGGMDHVRVHPKFLHSNATSHKWALGAFAELLDNSLDEVCNGATYVNIDMLINKKDGGNMLLIEDNGGGMDPDKVRQCMSLGYSAKSKLANTIGQYGNGFKTSTMRLGADVIVFTRSCGKDGKSVTQSIGLLAYTFLRCTGKEDIVVPILDYELRGREWKKMMRSSVDDWNRNVDTIINWSPYSSETELLQQFNLMKDHGTRIVIYNLWEDDQGQMELDFKSDRQDIQIRGVNRDEKNIEMAKEFPNSRHFLTYRHSLRSYASILYLRLPPNFRIILRGKDVEHHNVVNDMMMREEVTYRPQPGADGVPRNADMVAIVTIGFVKDATAHIDVQGFNVYHKNRLIKPFWRVWSAAGSDGRGVIGVLEANFVEPAHDKQGFERTIVLARLESKLVQMQKQYWRNYCHKIGYAPRVYKKQVESGDRESSPEYTPSSSRTRNKGKGMDHENSVSRLSDKHGGKTSEKNISLNEKHGGKTTENYVSVNEKHGEKTAEKYVSVNEKHGGKTAENYASVNENGGKTSGMFVSSSEKHRNGRTPNARYRESSEEPSSPSLEEPSDVNEEYKVPRRGVNGNRLSTSKTSVKDQLGKALPIGKTNSVPQQEKDINGGMDALSPSSSHVWHQLREENRTLKEKLQVLNELKEENRILKEKLQDLDRLKKENRTLKERLEGKNEDKLGALERDLEAEREKCKLLETKLHEAECKLEDLNKEQESLIDIFSEERDRRDVEEETLRKKIREASNTIEDLRERVVQLDRMSSFNSKR